MAASHDAKRSMTLSPLTLEFLQACHKGDKAKLYELIYNDVLQQDKDYATIGISLAYSENHLDVIKLLMLHGAKPISLLPQPQKTYAKLQAELKNLKLKYPELNTDKKLDANSVNETDNFLVALTLIAEAKDDKINQEITDALNKLTPKDFVDLSAIVNAQFPEKKSIVRKFSNPSTEENPGEYTSYPVSEFPRVFFKTFELIKACHLGQEARVCELIFYGALNKNSLLNTLAFSFAQNGSHLELAKLLYLQGIIGSNALSEDNETSSIDYSTNIASQFKLFQKEIPIVTELNYRFSHMLDIIDMFIKYKITPERLESTQISLKPLTVTDIVDLKAIASVLFPEKKSILDDCIKKHKQSTADIKEVSKPGLFAAKPKTPLSPDDHRKAYANLIWIKVTLQDEKSFPLDKHKQARGLLKDVTLNTNEHAAFKGDVQTLQSSIDNLFSTAEMESLKDIFLNGDKKPANKPGASPSG
jgi:hypothetical protein